MLLGINEALAWKKSREQYLASDGITAPIKWCISFLGYLCFISIFNGTNEMPSQYCFPDGTSEMHTRYHLGQLDVASPQTSAWTAHYYSQGPLLPHSKWCLVCLPWLCSTVFTPLCTVALLLSFNWTLNSPTSSVVSPSQLTAEGALLTILALGVPPSCTSSPLCCFPMSTGPRFLCRRPAHPTTYNCALSASLLTLLCPLQCDLTLSYHLTPPHISKFEFVWSLKFSISHH